MLRRWTRDKHRAKYELSVLRDLVVLAHQSPSGCRFTTRVRLRIERPAGFLLDRNRENGAGLGERAADRQRLVAVALEPFLDVVIEALQPWSWGIESLLPAAQWREELAISVRFFAAR
jgi:hypothetical protein